MRKISTSTVVPDKENDLMSRRQIVLLAFAVAVGTLGPSVVAVSQADAYVLLGHGCRYDPSNDDDGLGIGFNTAAAGYNSDENLRTQFAASDWNARMVPQFTIVSYGASTRDLAVTWAPLGTNVGAQTSIPCGIDHWTADPVMTWSTNATYYLPKTANNQTAIAVHEIGHSFGLAHNNNTSCTGSIAGLMYTDAVAKYNTCHWITPTTDDVTGATHAHNGG
jgi:hypothetical protein